MRIDVAFAARGCHVFVMVDQIRVLANICDLDREDCGRPHFCAKDATARAERHAPFAPAT